MNKNPTEFEKCALAQHAYEMGCDLLFDQGAFCSYQNCIALADQLFHQLFI